MAVLVLFIIAFSLTPENPPSDQCREGLRLFHEAYDKWDIAGFIKAGDAFDTAIRGDTKRALNYYWRGTVDFFLVSSSLFGRPQDRNDERAKEHIDSGIDNLEKAVALNSTDGESYALLATLTGMKISLSPYKALWLGPKVMKYKEKALELQPTSPRVHYLLGVSYFHAPALLGGKEKSVEHFTRACELFEGESTAPIAPDTCTPRWGYSECLMFLGRMYRSQKKYDKAKTEFTKALTVSSNNVLAREELDALQALMQAGGKPASP